MARSKLNRVMKYRVILELDVEVGGYIISCPALPGCVSQGETRKGALANIRDAIEGVLASRAKRGLSPLATRH
jgi:predicted RNase H-like HicB family nuclease